MKRPYAYALVNGGKPISVIDLPIADSTRIIFETQGYEPVDRETAIAMRKEMCENGFINVRLGRNHSRPH